MPLLIRDVRIPWHITKVGNMLCMVLWGDRLGLNLSRLQWEAACIFEFCKSIISPTQWLSYRPLSNAQLWVVVSIQGKIYSKALRSFTMLQSPIYLKKVFKHAFVQSTTIFTTRRWMSCWNYLSIKIQKISKMFAVIVHHHRHTVQNLPSI